MTVKELYDYILTQMTAEEALMKLLGCQIETYTKLKEGKFIDEKGQINPLFIIACAAMDLGWDFLIEKPSTDPDSDIMRGLSVGTKEYLDTLTKKAKDGTYKHNPSTEG